MGTSSGRRWRMVALGAVAALAAGVPSVAGASPPGCVAGAAGVGDAYFPTYGNGGYDVAHYDLDIAYDPASDRLDGEATIRARAAKSLCSFNLDLVGLEVESVTVNGRPATWDRAGQELTVTPERRVPRGQRFEVAVVYGGVPVAFTLPGFGIPTGFMATADGAIVAGQPESATAWFPVNDHPIDKASYTFDVSVPEGYEVVANGLPRRAGRGEPRPGWTTSRWEAREPMASYLATIDIGQWDERRWRTDDGLPVIDAVDPAITGAVRREVDDSLARQGEILDMLSAAFGPYPFSTAGGIVDSHEPFLFALETQTRSVYSWTFWEDNAGNPVDADWVVVHELAHQWFGDDVALARWQDIWLNEGFASYAEWLWEEHEGRATPAETLRATHAAIPADDPFWSVTIGDPGPEQLFHEAVYARGAMTLQALREEVGDEAFWRIIRTWAASNRRGHGTTPEFIALAERIAGQQLDALFDTWLFTPAKPALPASPAAPEAATLSSDAAAAGADGWWARFQQREHNPH